MPGPSRPTPDVDGDSSDVVTGQVGSAHLVEPVKADAVGADLDRLQDIDVDEQATTETAQGMTSPAG